MEIKLQQRLSQQMVMTPQMQQAMKLLQMTSMEIDSFVEQELLDNPTLERDDDDSLPTLEEWDSSLPSDGSVPSSTLLDDNGANDPTSDDIIPLPATQDEEYGDVPSEVTADQEELTSKMADDIDWDSYRANNDYDNYPIGEEAGVGRDAPDQVSYENFVGANVTLIEHLEWQIQVGAEFSMAERPIAVAIVGSLDERGYCPENIVTTLAADFQVPEEVVLSVLGKVQFLDPVGIGARNLTECLRAQLVEHGVEDDLISLIVDKYLADFSPGKVAVIARETKRKEAEVQQAMRTIRQLEPYPARNFFYTPAVEARPDVTVRRIDGDYIVTVESGYGHLRVSPEYKRMLGRRGKKDNPLKVEVRDYLHERLDRAKWLVNTLHSREDTLKAVMEAIIALQEEFFATGDSRLLKPLILRDIATHLEVNESTISRVTAGKYVSTEHGLLPLRFFFNSSISADSGEDMAAEGVKQTIADLVKAEDPHKPLSDQQLVEILKTKGLNIARRTVAKYRESLNIPSSSARKKTF